MEDRHAICRMQNGNFLYAVFDGHGGETIAQLCRDNVGPVYQQCLIQAHNDASVAIRKCFGALDVLAKHTNQDTVGCTAVAVVTTKDRILFANAGDSMTMIAYKNGDVELMSVEHKVEHEKERIKQSGGLVTYWDGVARINGMLNVARSIGDYHLKTHVISEPFVRTLKRGSKDIEWILIASDGIWDVFDVHTVARELRELIRVEISKSSGSKEEAVRTSLIELVRRATMRGSTDNITVMYIDGENA